MILTISLSLRKKIRLNIGDQLGFDKTTPCLTASRAVDRSYLGQWFPDLKLLAVAEGV